MDWSIHKILNYSSGLFDFDELYDRVSGKRWNNWADRLSEEIPAAFEISQNGHLPMWTETYDKLPNVSDAQISLDQSVVKARSHSPLPAETRQLIEESLLKLLPWRKGPFRVHDVFIDSEWQSNLKWDRLKDEITPLDGRRILDVGCGNGYYAMRMLGSGARFVIGVDPYLRYVVQFRMLAKFFGSSVRDAMLAPVGIESVPRNLEMFDTVFSMGVIYHQRSPFDHLQLLFESLRSEGELVLETIVVDGDSQTVLLPKERYAKMKNVWFIPSTAALELWLQRAGFIDVRTVNIHATTILEQRSTKWMPFESLVDFLDFTDPELTFEGYPAPKRTIIIARKP